MKRKIFLVVSLVTILAALLVFGSGIFAINMSAENAVLERLETETKLVASLVNSREDFSKLEQYRSSQDLRITVIAEDGTVLFDTDTSEPLENHSEREEFIAAMKGQPKVVRRYSETFGCDMNYYAIKTALSDGENVVLRLAVRETLIKSYVTLSMPVFILLLLIVLALSFEAGNQIARKVSARFSDISASIQSVADGNYTPIKTSTRDAEMYSLIGSINDVNARISRHIQNAETQQKTLSTVLSAISQGIIALDSEKRIVFINKSALKLFGINDYTPDGEKHDLIFVVDNLNLYALISSHADENFAFDFRLDDKDLNILITKVEDETLRDEITTIIVISDVTSQKSVARQKSDFFQNASHELKTPVTVIRGLTEILLQKDNTDEFTKKKLSSIHDESLRLSSIISDMLKLSSLENTVSVREDEEDEKVDLVAAAHEIMAELSPRAEEKKLSVSITGKGWVNMLRSNALELLDNLCSNAINYNKEGGKISIDVMQDDSNTILKVIDTGIGIEQQHIPRLCERFYRVDKSRSKKTGGTGLGLAIVKHICLRYGAHLDIDSTFGEGTCVTVTFPVTPSKSLPGQIDTPQM